MFAEENMNNNRDRIIGVVGGLLIYETLLGISFLFARIYSGVKNEPLHQMTYPLCVILILTMGYVTYLFFRNPMRHALWLGIVATAVGLFKIVVFSVATNAKITPPLHLWVSLGMSVQLISSPLIIGFCCLYLKRTNRTTTLS